MGKLKLDFNSEVSLEEQKEAGMNFLKKHCEDFIETARAGRKVRVDHARELHQERLAAIKHQEEEEARLRLEQQEEARIQQEEAAARQQLEEEEVSSSSTAIPFPFLNPRLNTCRKKGV